MDGKMIKVAISGQARTGKNTLAEMIVNNVKPIGLTLGIPTHKIVAVADPIKNIVMQMVPNADPECLWGQSEFRSKPIPGDFNDLDGNPLTYRRALIDIGTLGRKYNPDIWLNALVQDAAKNQSLRVYVVSDVRFPNEINYLKDHGFYMIRLKRLGVPQIDDVSETAQLQIPDSFFDDVIENDGPLSELNRRAEIIVHKFV
jgi:hypothetical protein